MTAQPEVVQYQLSNQDEFVVLASDGLWDKLSNEEAVGLVYDTVKQPAMAAQRCACYSLFGCQGACMLKGLWRSYDL